MSSDDQVALLRMLAGQPQAGNAELHFEPGADPTLALLAALLGRAPNNAEDAATDVDRTDGGDDLELVQLREISATLAAALGACQRCWGTDPTCRRCDGDGAPGAFRPDVDLFRDLIAPAVQRMKRMSERERRRDGDR
jgi:hypothetical protein